MATCNTDIGTFQSEPSSLNVSDKYVKLMQDSLSDDSLYQRTKDTLHTLFSDFNISEAEKASLVATHMIQFGTGLSDSAMKTALSWAKEERDGAYTLAKIKADTATELANLEKVKAEICVLDKEVSLKNANITSITSANIRENGGVNTYGADGVTAETLNSAGLKYEQTEQVKAATYQIFADTFRKSGVVDLKVDPEDNVRKGMSGDEDGYTYQQTQAAIRQISAFDDSMLNHAANSSAAMIGQMLSAEIAPETVDVDRWRRAMDGLLVNVTTTTTTDTAPAE